MTAGAMGTWRETPSGGTIARGGGSEATLTGSWRTERPVIDFERCTHCMICWVYCPDSCFDVEAGRLLAVDLDHCKGCGICAKACPPRCIEMVPETRGG